MTKLKAFGLGTIAMLCFGTGFAASQADIQACLTTNHDIIANSQDNVSISGAKINVGGGCSSTTMNAAMWQCVDQQVVQGGVSAVIATQNCINKIQ